MKNTSKAPKPDPKIGKAAVKQAELGNKWLGFAKHAWKKSTNRQKSLDKLTRRVTWEQMGMMREQNEWAREDRERYETMGRMAEDAFMKEAENYGSQERQDAAVAAARSDVRAAADVQKNAALREAQGLGIAPGSGRYAGIERATERSTALAEVDAVNNARTSIQDKAIALKADAANFARGLPSQSAQAATLGLNSGNSALGNRQATNAQFLQSTGIMGDGYRGAIAGQAGMADTLTRQYGLELDAWKTEQQLAAQNAAGIGQAVGGIIGLFASDEDLKENKEEIPDGEALDAIKNMPVEEWDYKPGVADEGHHIGTYAQDFQRETGKGDGRTIAAQDAIGITMRAVQDLDAKVDRIADAVGISASSKNTAAAQPGLGAKRAA